jgi:hypothetical protein
MDGRPADSETEAEAEAEGAASDGTVGTATIEVPIDGTAKIEDGSATVGTERDTEGSTEVSSVVGIDTADVPPRGRATEGTAMKVVASFAKVTGLRAEPSPVGRAAEGTANVTDGRAPDAEACTVRDPVGNAPPSDGTATGIEIETPAPESPSVTMPDRVAEAETPADAERPREGKLVGIDTIEGASVASTIVVSPLAREIATDGEAPGKVESMAFGRAVSSDGRAVRI